MSGTKLATYESRAPDILDLNYAEEVGTWLVHIASKNNNFFSYFEQPPFNSADLEFSENTFKREVQDVFTQGDQDLCFQSLIDAGLIREVAGSSIAGRKRYQATCRINVVECRSGAQSVTAILCTDSPVVNRSSRVFPWSDEGEKLFQVVARNWNSEPPRRILDLCSGAGTACVLMANHWPDADILGIDNSIRANKYANFNARFNRCERFEVNQFDLVKDGGHSSKFNKTEFDIVSINPPFTPMPRGVQGYEHSSSQAVIAAAVASGLQCVAPGGLLALLTYGYGSAEDIIPQSIEDIFSSLDLGDFEELEIEKIGGPVWNLRGEKSNPLNPMPVRYMAPRYYDPDWNPNFIRAETSYGDFVNWIETEFVEKGLTHLHYVAVLLKKRL